MGTHLFGSPFINDDFFTHFANILQYAFVILVTKTKDLQRLESYPTLQLFFINASWL